MSKNSTALSDRAWGNWDGSKHWLLSHAGVFRWNRKGLFRKFWTRDWCRLHDPAASWLHNWHHLSLNSRRFQGNFNFFFPGVEAHFPSNFSVKFDIQKSVDSVAYLIQSDLEAYAASFDHHSKIVLRSQDLHRQILSTYCPYILRMRSSKIQLNHSRKR